MKAVVRIGCGAGYSGDRIEPAAELAERGRLDYLVFECLAERTIAIAQQARTRDAQAGYDPLLVDRMNAVLPACRRNRVRVITNMGAANPIMAARVIADRARALGLGGLKIAAVTGDDVLELVRSGGYDMAETAKPVGVLGNRLVSANAYVGAEPVIEALRAGADVVVTGRVSDPSLFLAPAMFEFGWRPDNWPRLAAGALVGHLLECAGQITGGYFADPRGKDVPDLARLGFPLAEVSADGSAVITKVEGSGGRVSLATCKEQLLYEIDNPGCYITPDVIADFSGVSLADNGPDRVSVSGAAGSARPPTLKVAVGYRDGFIGEGQISYAGSSALQRASLARDVVKERFRLLGITFDDVRYDLIGVDALHGAASRPAAIAPYEVRLRVAARTASAADAAKVGNEVEALYTNGPAGGGGAVKTVRDVLAIGSTFVPRELVRPALHLEVA